MLIQLDTTWLEFSLEYDTTLCKAAFLPELSIERRVDVPKKFILPDVDVDSTNHNNVKLFNEASDDEVSEDEVEQQVGFVLSCKFWKLVHATSFIT